MTSLPDSSTSSYLPLALIAIASAVVFLVAWPHIVFLVSDWTAREEYSHGMLIPVLSAYLIYQRRDALAGPRRGVWMAVCLFLAGLLVVFVGSVSTTPAISQYGLVLAIIGVFYLVFGTGSWKQTMVPLALLFFMVPLPHFLHQALSAKLQLFSSELGVFFVSLFGISVYLEGNVIDLGTYKLQVLEACDGLRYLFPLLSLSFIFAYLYRAPLWARVTLFLSAVPITVLMNSVRIGMIGVMVEHWGTAMAEGFLHDFQGWSIFLVSVVILLLEAKVLARLCGDHRPLIELFGMDVPDSEKVDSIAVAPSMAAAVVALGAALLVFTGLSAVEAREPPPGLSRQDFLDFPLSFSNGWRGQRRTLERIYIDELKLDDYLVADYQSSASDWANLYVAYYDDQSGGRSVHSPRTCLPGGGWEMQSFQVIELADSRGRRHPVNRVVIGKGFQKQLVYYWFEQRGRVLANEYAVKWYLLRDSIVQGRTDGALVRLISPISVGSDGEAEERALAEMYRNVRGTLPEFLPG